MQNMTPQQQQQLMQQAMQMAQACQACNNMGQQMGQMAQAAMSQNGQSGESSSQGGMQAMQGMLSQMEMMQMEQMSAQAMLAQTQAQMASMCQNPGSGMSSLQGGQTGTGPMAGQGSNHATGEETAAVEVDRQAQRTPTHLGQGPIVAERLVYGELVRGESVAQFSSAVQAASTGVAEAIEENVVPIEWQESLQSYFGRLQKRAEVVQGTAPKPAPAEEKPEGGN
ncbi:MAG: hypothetical protein ACIAQU_04090, partial [Phycisphaerales bacterium JB064]